MSYATKQAKAALIISRYSLLATLRSPTSIVFSVLFPIIFITVFGSIKVGQAPAMKLAIASGSDTSAFILKAINSLEGVKIERNVSAAQQNEELKKGRIVAVISINADHSGGFVPRYNIRLLTSGSSGTRLSLLKTEINEAVANINQRLYPKNPSIATVVIKQAPGRIYRDIDFILPGQLGFSLLMAGVYGSSFLLFSLRQNLVLKRLRTAPVSRHAIIGGEMLSRLLFHVISFIIMVALGYFVFNFTLVNGIATFVEMLFFSMFGLFIFMAIGFIISGVVQNENSIAPIANTVVLPQILLCGLFFPIENYPHTMQVICNALPLSLFVDGLRKIAFEGTHFWQMPLTLCGLILWTLVMLPLSMKLFKWE